MPSEFSAPVNLLADMPDPLAGLPPSIMPAPLSPSAPLVEMLPITRTRTIVMPASVGEMQTKYQKMHTQNQLRQQMLRLIDRNVDDVHTWLHDIAKDSPAAAVDRFIELLKFGLPQLKEATLNVTRDGSTKTFRSSEEILQELNNPETPT